MGILRRDSIENIGTATTWNDLKSKVDLAIERLGNPEIIWYRGQNDSNHTPLPSIFRYENGIEKERDLYIKYTSWIPEATKKDDIDGWDILCKMQHYRIPTRLLDWTEKLGVAVFFSHLEAKEEASIFILDPKKLNHTSNIKDVQPPKYLTISRQFNYKEMFVNNPDNSNDKKEEFIHPIAIEPPNRDDPRIRAQFSTFTVHGTMPYDKQFFECIKEVKFNFNALATIKMYLKDTGYNEYSIFPDIEGASPFIKSQVGLKTKVEYILERIEEVLRKKMEDIFQALSSNNATNNKDINISGIDGCKIDAGFLSREDQINYLYEWLERVGDQYKVIVAPAGYGKTNLILKFIHEHKLHLKLAVVFFPFSSYNSEKSLIWNLQNKIREKTNLNEEPIIEEAIVQMIKNGKLLLILDGLDEFSRIKGEDNVKKLEKELLDICSKKSKVIISCRDHILKELKEVTTEITKNGVVELEQLKESIIINEIPEELGEFLPQILCIPLFYDVYTRLSKLSKIDVNNIKSESQLYDEWLNVILRTSNSSSGNRVKKNSEIDKEKRKIGEIAKIMLENRTFFVDKKLEPKDLEIVERLSEKALGIFTKDGDEKWIFYHQQLREFILSWSIRYDLEKGGKTTILSEASAFDYEGGETFRLLHDMYEADAEKIRIDLIPKIIKNIEFYKNKMEYSEAINNVIRNGFEVLGMIAENVDNSIINWVLKIIADNTIKDRVLKKNGSLYTFKTKYNLVRFLERMHCSAPQPYFKEVMNCFRNEEEFKHIKAWTIRGFQEEVPKRKMANLWFVGDFKEHNLQEKVSNQLISIMENLSDYYLSEEAEFLEINCAFALVRWAYKSQSHINRIKKLLNTGTLCAKSIYNLKEALKIIHEQYGD